MRAHRIIAVTAFIALLPAQTLAQTALKSDDLVGRWGVTAYWNDGDAPRMIAQARGFCSQPYVITRGTGGGAIMFEPFDGKRREMRVSGSQIVAADGESRSTKTISSWNGSTLVFSYDDDEAKRKYGNMVFVKCGR
jgi:hypothetical protein